MKMKSTLLILCLLVCLVSIKSGQCAAPMDVVFVLDSSRSVGWENFGKMKDFVISYLHDAEIDDGDVRVGISTYSTQVTVQFKLNSYKTKTGVFDAVNDIPLKSGATNTADALKTMHKEMFNEANGDRPDVPNICILMTDGFSNINTRRTILEANIAKRKGIHILAIGIALKDLHEVNGIASEPASANVFAVDTFDELKGLEKATIRSDDHREKRAVDSGSNYKDGGKDGNGNDGGGFGGFYGIGISHGGRRRI